MTALHDFRPTDVERAVAVVEAWRASAGILGFRDDGIVLVSQGAVCGWRYGLGGRPLTMAGVVAVDVQRRAWIACGSDEQGWATVWHPVEPE